MRFEPSCRSDAAAGTTSSIDVVFMPLPAIFMISGTIEALEPVALEGSLAPAAD